MTLKQYNGINNEQIFSLPQLCLASTTTSHYVPQNSLRHITMLAINSYMDKLYPKTVNIFLEALLPWGYRVVILRFTAVVPPHIAVLQITSNLKQHERRELEVETTVWDKFSSFNTWLLHSTENLLWHNIHILSIRCNGDMFKGN